MKKDISLNNCFLVELQQKIIGICQVKEMFNIHTHFSIVFLFKMLFTLAQTKSK